MNEEQTINRPFLTEEEFSYLRTFIAKSFRDARKKSMNGEGDIDWISTASTEVAEGLVPIMIHKIEHELARPMSEVDQDKQPQEEEVSDTEQAGEEQAQGEENNPEPEDMPGKDTDQTVPTTPSDLKPSAGVSPSTSKPSAGTSPST